MVDWGGGASGAVSGAAAGAPAGGWGAGIGAGLGFLGGLFGGGKKNLNKQISTQTPEQQNYLQNLFSQLGAQGGIGQNQQLSQDYLQRMLSGDPQSYNRWAAPYETQFRERDLPMLAERYGGALGPYSHGLQESSGGMQALGGAASQFRSNLAGLYAQLQQQAANQAMSQYGNLSGLGLSTRAFQPTLEPGYLGAGQQALAGTLGGLSQAGGQNLSQLFSEWLANRNNPATGTDTGGTK